MSLRGPLEIFGVRSREEYLAKQAAFCFRLGKKPFVVTDAHPEVYVNEDRLLLDCAAGDCRSGVVVSAEWRLGCCFECGAIYQNVVIPVTISPVTKASS